jgi:Flp pilus assembly protein TadG
MHALSTLRRNFGGQCGAQIVEFAVSLPLLVVFVVGIFDFSGAFTLKQKLTNIARDAARLAAADPSSDVPLSSTTLPASVADAYQEITNYFTANQLNNCGVTAASGTLASPATWTFSGATGCTGPGLTIIINRGYYFPESNSSLPPSVSCASQAVGAQTAVIGTCVSIQYGYQWRFGHVVSLLGSSAVLPSAISATAVAMNEN